MAYFHPLSVGDKHYRVFAHNIAAAYGFETDGFPISRAGLSFATVNGALRQVAAERLGDHLPHFERGAGGCIDLVAVMRLDDLDIDAVAEHARGHVEPAPVVDAQVEITLGGAQLGRQPIHPGLQQRRPGFEARDLGELGRDALNRDPTYRGLLASAEYEAWLGSRQ